MLLLLSLLFFQPALADCDKNFSALLHSKPPANSASPTRIFFPTNAEEIAQEFDLALTSWNRSFRPNILRKKIARIGAGGPVDQEISISLQSNLNQAELLLSYHAALHPGGSTPTALRRFASALDDLTSTINSHQSPATIKESAKVALGSLSELEASVKFRRLGAVRPEEIHRRMEAKLATFRSFLREELPTPQKLGVISSEIQELLLFARNAQALRPSPETNTAYTYLYGLHLDLNRLHIDFLNRAKSREISYYDQKFFLNPNHRTRLEKLTAALAQTLSSSGAPQR